MAALGGGKYHIMINSTGYILGRNRRGLQYYEKKKAPSFVSKFGSGDSSYRDSTFWQFFAQTNFRNGAQQLKWDDAGKYWLSENVDTTQLEKLTLSPRMTSAGQLASGVSVNKIESWRTTSGSTAFGDGSDGALTIGSNTTEAPVDSACTGTIGTTTLTATNASFAASQKILIHQSRGTGAGNYEVNTISAYTAGTITTSTPLGYTYTSGAQVRVLKQYSSVTIDSTKIYTAKAWNGTVGGILGWLCNGTTTITGNASASGKGYIGGPNRGWAGNVTNTQGEGTAGAGGYSTAANGNGGGGGEGNDGSSNGGGGGGYYAAGTTGQAAGETPGTGGSAVGVVSLSTLFFGGAGGAGGTSDDGGTGGGAGGNGGGIVIITSKTISISGTIVTTGGTGGTVSGGSANDSGGGGGGAGGSVFIKAQIATLGTNLITAAAGAAGTSPGPGGDGGAGSVGRIHLSYLNSYSGTTTPTLDVSQDSTLADNPPGESYTAYAGTSGGKIYSYDDGTIWTEVFDCRRLTWFDDETTVDGHGSIGDVSDTEYAEAQGFQLSAATTVKSLEIFIKKGAGTPGNITVRIETNNAGVPSGTLAHANATTTITAFTDTNDSWKETIFTNTFTLAASTVYWVVVKIAASGTNNYYGWGLDASSPSYTNGTRAYSSNGGSSWTADATKDNLFRILGDATSVNCSLVTTVGGTQKMLWGVGSPGSTVNGEARLYSYDGTTWALNYTFTTVTSAQVLSLEEYTDISTAKVFVGVGPQAVVYSTTDLSTYTSAKDISKPQNPGYIWKIKEYNRYLYAMGGSPELLPSSQYNGFIYYYDTSEWNSLYPFTFTVIRSAEFYDAYLFLGTYHGQLFVYDTSSLTPIFSFKDLYGYKLTVNDMLYFDDKLYIATIPQEGSGETNAGVWAYDRHGLHLAHQISGITGYYCLSQVNNNLLIGCSNGMVYKVDPDYYEASGSLQSSYYDANLPSIPKLYNEVAIRHDPLPAGTSISVYYKFKEADELTLLGTSDTEDTEEANFPFDSGTTSNKISVSYTLATSASTSTPTLTEAILKYSLLPPRKWQWNMRILAKSNLVLLDKTTSSLTATQIRTAVENSQDTDGLITFTDIDGQTYSCLFNDIEQPSWVIDQDTANENLINVALIEA